MSGDYYRDSIGTPAQRIGRQIYRRALEDRRGFRPGQICIPEDDEVWLEIFQDIGTAALELTKESRS